MSSATTMAPSGQETSREAVVREVQEELGIRLRFARAKAVFLAVNRPG